MELVSDLLETRNSVVFFKAAITEMQMYPCDWTLENTFVTRYIYGWISMVPLPHTNAHSQFSSILYVHTNFHLNMMNFSIQRDACFDWHFFLGKKKQTISLTTPQYFQIFYLTSLNIITKAPKMSQPFSP